MLFEHTQPTVAECACIATYDFIVSGDTQLGTTLVISCDGNALTTQFAKQVAATIKDGGLGRVAIISAQSRCGQCGLSCVVRAYKSLIAECDEALVKNVVLINASEPVTRAEFDVKPAAHTCVVERAHSTTFHHYRVNANNYHERAFVIRDVCFQLTRESIASVDRFNYRVIKSSTCDGDVQSLLRGSLLAFDTECSSQVYSDDYVVSCVSVASGDTVIVWDYQALYQSKECLRALKFVLESDVPKCGHNVKFDTVAVHSAFGIDVKNVQYCTMLLSRLRHSDASASLDERSYSIGVGGFKKEFEDSLSAARAVLKPSNLELSQPQLFTNTRALPDSLHKSHACKVAQGDRVDKYAYSYVPTNVLTKYNARDAATSLLLMRDILQQPDLHNMFAWRTCLQHINSAFTELEKYGVAISRVNIGLLSKKIAVERKALEKKLSLHSSSVNWDSPTQLKDYLYNKLMLHTATQDTTADTLALIRNDHPVVPLLLQWKKLATMKRTFVDGLMLRVSDDGRIHPSFNPYVRTGRASCTDPNLQNIPSPSRDREGEFSWGKATRNTFVANSDSSSTRDKVFLEFDYSQLELRIATLLSNDKAMLEIWKSDTDFHLMTAKLLAPFFGVDPASIDKKHWLRSAAKIANFAILYGKTAEALARDISEETGRTFDVSDALKVYDSIFKAFPQLKRYVATCKENTRRTGYAQTWWQGMPLYTRYLWDIAGSDRGLAGSAERSAFNTPVQGTATTFCLMSVHRIVETFRALELSAHVVLTVHDSILVECDRGAAQEVYEIVHNVMRSWDSRAVPLKVDCGIGFSWGDMHEVNTQEKILEFVQSA